VKSERRNILQHIGRTALAPPEHIGRGLPAPVLVKCEHLNPGAPSRTASLLRSSRTQRREAPENLHRDVIDGADRVSDEGSFAMAKRLVREEGLLVGGSAGTHVVAAPRLAVRGNLDGPVVTILPDSWDRYRAKHWMQEWAS